MVCTYIKRVSKGYYILFVDGSLIVKHGEGEGEIDLMFQFYLPYTQLLAVECR